LCVAGLTVRFGRAVALDALDLDVAPGAFVALLGGSGSGKSTLLRAIAGFVVPAAGQVSIYGRDLGPLPPERRPLHMMFQFYALFPHMSVVDNVGYGLRRAGIAASRRRWRWSALARSAADGRRRFRAGRSSARRWRGRWCYGHDCCCWTNRSARWTRACANARVPTCARCNAPPAPPS